MYGCTRNTSVVSLVIHPYGKNIFLVPFYQAGVCRNVILSRCVPCAEISVFVRRHSARFAYRFAVQKGFVGIVYVSYAEVQTIFKVLSRKIFFSRNEFYAIPRIASHEFYVLFVPTVGSGYFLPVVVVESR